MIFTSEALKKWRDSDAERETGAWKIKLIFVGGTSGSLHVKTFNDRGNLKELQVCVYYCITNSSH